VLTQERSREIMNALMCRDDWKVVKQCLSALNDCIFIYLDSECDKAADAEAHGTIIIPPGSG